MNETILVTGAGGNVGREVVRALAARRAPVRAALFNVDDERRDLPDGVEAARFDFEDPTTFPAALAGVGRVFLMRPPAISDVNRAIKPFIDYAARTGPTNAVAHIVFLSLLGVERNPVVPHARIETLLQDSGVPWTMLRCGFFMQNLDTTHRADIVEHGDLFIPAGRGRTAFIDARDIGAVAARVLTEAGHDNRAYRLTGQEALTYDEVAAIMTETLGRRITYSRPSFLAFARRMRRRGHPWSYIAVMAGVYLTTRLGLAEAVTPDAAALLGRPPITMRQYVRDYACKFA
jgi:uncharacterized protein YbjT (DUF2867 family)